MHILVVEDDREFVAELCSFLEQENYRVSCVEGQQEALTALSSQSFDLVLLDITLKEGNGYALCSAIKSAYDLPVIFLSALGDEYSTVTGFELGGDDYVSKPFRPLELISRIRNILRRYGKNTVITLGDLVVDTAKGQVLKNGNDANLSALEYRLLLFFLNNRGRLVMRDMLAEEIFSLSGEYIQDNTITVYIRRLREKIEDASHKYIVTVRGMGYRLEEEK